MPAQDATANGLSSKEASERLTRDGTNSIPDTSAHPVRDALAKFWAPVPWLLEASVVLQIVLHKYVEAAVIAGLLVFNAALAYFQEGRAQATLTALKSRLALNASVRRDGAWKTVPAADLVCGDVVKLSLGGVVAADVHLLDGSVQLDQSMLTGESLPVEAGAGSDTYAGALVRRGEATAEVTATGVRTKFGRTAELVRTAHVVSSQQTAVLRIVRNLAIFNGFVIASIGLYAYSITSAGVILGLCFLAFCVALLAIGKFHLGLGLEALRTLSVVAIVYGSQATIYAMRERKHLWGLRPSRWLILSSVADIAIITTLASRGIAMAPLPFNVIASEFAAAVALGVVLDLIKVPVFARLGIA